jgi:hypothetical protein
VVPGEALRRALADGRVLAALAGVFRSNRHDAEAPWGPPAPSRAPEALAGEAVRRLLDPVTSGVADVGGLRFYLMVASEVHPGPSAVHVAAWDDDAGVWRPVAEVPLPGL